MQTESNHMAWPQAFEQNQQVLYNLRAMKTSVFSLGVTGTGGQSHSFICGDGGKEERTCLTACDPTKKPTQNRDPGPNGDAPSPQQAHVKPSSSLPREAAVRKCQGLMVPEGAHGRDTQIRTHLLQCKSSILRAGIGANRFPVQSRDSGRVDGSPSD